MVYHGHQNICLWEDDFLFKSKNSLYKWILVLLETTFRDITHESGGPCLKPREGGVLWHELLEE